MGGISIPQLLIILAIVVVLFGTKRFRSLGSDLGSAIKGFKKAVNDDPQEDADFKDKAQLNKQADEGVKAQSQDTSEQQKS